MLPFTMESLVPHLTNGNFRACRIRETTDIYEWNTYISQECKETRHNYGCPIGQIGLPPAKGCKSKANDQRPRSTTPFKAPHHQASDLKRTMYRHAHTTWYQGWHIHWILSRSNSNYNVVHNVKSPALPSLPGPDSWLSRI